MFVLVLLPKLVWLFLSGQQRSDSHPLGWYSSGYSSSTNTLGAQLRSASTSPYFPLASTRTWYAPSAQRNRPGKSSWKASE
jgi:hypothetical protein